MIIYLKNANFTTSNIGKIDSYRVICTLGVGATYTGPTIISKDNSGFSAKIVIDEGYVVKAANIVVTVDGTAVTPTIAGNEISINVTTKVAGDIVIKVPTSVAGAPTYTVTYQINGHGTQPAAVTEVTALPDSLPVLSDTGWDFAGWFTDSACTTVAIAGTPITANTTLYAKWTEKPAVDPSTCTHDWSGTNGHYACNNCGMPNYSLVTIVPDAGVESVTVTKVAGWGTLGQKIESGTNVHINDTLRVVIVPKAGYVVVGEADYTTRAYSGGCTITANTIVYEDVEYEVIDPSTYDTHADYFVTTAGKTNGPYSTWKYDVIPVTPGRKYYINTVAGQAARIWLMLNGPDPLVAGTIISYSQDSSAAALKEEYVVAPEGATHMCVNTRKDKSEYPIIKVHPTYGV